MNKKLFTVIFLLICFAIVGVLFFATTNKSTDIFENNEPVDTEKYFLGYPIYNVLLEEGTDYYVQFENIYYQDDNISDMYVRFNDFCVTKERGDYDFDFEERYNPPDDKRNLYEIDSEGNILNDWSYLVMKVTVINYDANPLTIGMNALSCQLGKKYGDCTKNSPDYYNSKYGPDSYNYGIIELAPNKKYDFTLACIVEDKYIEPYVSKGEYYLNVEVITTEEKNPPIVKKERE